MQVERTSKNTAQAIYLCRPAYEYGVAARRRPVVGDTILCVLRVLDNRRVDLDVQHMEGNKIIRFKTDCERQLVAQALGEVADLNCDLHDPQVGYFSFEDDDGTKNDSLDLIFPEYPDEYEPAPETLSEAGRIGGSKTSAAKVRTARENGKKGGRPRKEGKK